MNKMASPIAILIFLIPTRITETTKIIFPKIVLNNDAFAPGITYKSNQKETTSERSPVKNKNVCLLPKNLYVKIESIYKFII